MLVSGASFGMAADLKFQLSGLDLANLAIQRTTPLIALGGRQALDHWFATGDKQPIAFLLQEVAAPFLNQVVQEIRREAEDLDRYLDFSAIRNVASIGPGLCIFEFLMYQRHSCRLYLIDIETSTEHQAGFHQHGSGYSDNTCARRFLEDNGVPPTDIEFCNPRKQPLRSTPTDLIISNISMGFHYPVTEYVSYIQQALVPGGFLVFDKRKGVEDQGWKALSPAFDQVASLDWAKAMKLVCKRR